MKAARGLELVSCPTARTRQLADLSEEMIMEILLRLPARTLFSLKSVCRSWRNLISAPDFTRNHLRRSCLRDPRIAFCSPYGIDRIGVFSVQSMMDNPSKPTKVDWFGAQCCYSIVGSCHGLLCLFDYDVDQKMHVILWNPCTGFTFESPEISREKACFSGLGYDHVSDSYKFYATVEKKGTSGFEYSTRIYTFGPTSSWRRIDNISSSLLTARAAYEPCMAVNKIGVFFSNSKACTINWSFYDVVLYFDLDKETYGHFPLPARDSDDIPSKLFIHLCVLRNCLSVCYEHRKTKNWIVSQMKEYGNAQSWTTLATIPFDPPPIYYVPLQPLYISESDVLLAISPSLKRVLCNLNDFPVIDSSGDAMKNYPLSLFIGSARMYYTYHESIVSPNGLQSNSSKMLPFHKT